MSLTKRQIQSKYKGSALGVIWSILVPILMLVVYSFVFSVIFKSKWSDAGREVDIHFSLILFLGLTIHSFMSESLMQACEIFRDNRNMVKKVAVPLELLPITCVLTNLFHFFIQISILFVLYVSLYQTTHAYMLMLPVIALVMTVMVLGIVFFFSSLAVYFKDLTQGIGIVSMIMLFCAPIFFPFSSVPESAASVVTMNPITVVVVEARKVFFWAELPDFHALLSYLAVSIIMLIAGLLWFKRTKKGFADVL